MSSLMLGPLDLTAGPYEAQVGSSLGSWASITTALTSLFLDGSVVSGEATANRQITLQVFVNATTQAALTAACEALIGEANKASNTLTWTPDGGVPIVYEVFRTAGPVQTDAPGEFQLFHIYQLVFPALPFARSAIRQSAIATAPAAMLETFDAPFTGIDMTNRPTGEWQAPVLVAGTTPLYLLNGATHAGVWTAVTNATLTNMAGPYGSYGPAEQIAATAGTGLVEARTTASWTIGSAEVVTVAGNFYSGGTANTPTPTRPILMGVEWLDGGGASLRVDWGAPDVGTVAYSSWAASRKPTGAVSVRARVRLPADGSIALICQLIIVTSTLGTVTPAAAPHDGATALLAPMQGSTSTAVQARGSGYVYRALPAAVNVSAQARLTLWVLLYETYYGTGLTVSVRLFDSTGRWTRWTMTGLPTAASTWTQTSAVLASPYLSGSAGAANLTDVVAYDVDLGNTSTDRTINTPFMYLDTLSAGPAPLPNLSSRGTVLVLSPILGSARTTAAVVVSVGTPLTDWLVAAIDGTTGLPLLTVTTNVGTVAAPAGYDGVYSILGCIAPATVLAAPTCTIAQLNAGVSVATRVLTGTTRTGNRYVDFGAVELPLVATPPENLGVSYTFTLAPSSASWVEVLVIDVDASLAWVDNLITSLPVGWVDEPDIVAGLGKVWVGTATDRSDARALALPPTMSRPLQVKAPSTRLLVYSTTVAPNVMLTYWPRWLVEPS